MEIIFLGTGTSQGIPVIGCDCQVCKSTDQKDKRTRSSIWIDTGKNHILIDTSPDLRSQLLRENITSVDAILYTHEHKDHTGGLDDIRPIYFRKKTPMPVFGNKQTLNAIKTDYAYIFEKERYPGVPEIVLNYIENYPFYFNTDKIIPIHVHHYKNPVFGYRINNTIYITDAKAIPSEEMEKLFGCDILIINALRIQPHYSHLNLKETLQIIETVKPKRAFITHISHQMGLSESIDLPENISLAYDGMKISDI